MGKIGVLGTTVALGVPAMKKMSALFLFFLFGLISVAAQQRPVPEISWQAVQRGAAYEPHMLEVAARYGIDPRWLWIVGYINTFAKMKRIA